MSSVLQMFSMSFHEVLEGIKLCPFRTALAIVRVFLDNVIDFMPKVARDVGGRVDGGGFIHLFIVPAVFDPEVVNFPLQVVILFYFMLGENDGVVNEHFEERG